MACSFSPTENSSAGVDVEDRWPRTRTTWRIDRFIQNWFWVPVASEARDRVRLTVAPWVVTRQIGSAPPLAPWRSRARKSTRLVENPRGRISSPPGWRKGCVVLHGARAGARSPAARHFRRAPLPGERTHQMAAMMLSGISASLAARPVLPARAASKARAGQAIPMQPMGASKRAVRLSTVASAAPTPGGVKSSRCARTRPSPRARDLPIPPRAVARCARASTRDRARRSPPPRAPEPVRLGKRSRRVDNKTKLPPIASRPPSTPPTERVP